MTPEGASKVDGEEIVISGMSGLYPESHSIKEFSDLLYNKQNLITKENTRWNFVHPEIPEYMGKVPELDLFDAQFFKVHFRVGVSMDCMVRKVLEQSYQAIYDAGVSPEQLSGKKVGVYMGSCFSETEKACFYVWASENGSGIVGSSKTMFANRVSYWLNTKGPSLALDQACCSSYAALEQGFHAVARGECEAAIVGAAHVCLHPQSTIHYGRVVPLSKDGKLRSFDQNADGIVRSEAINVLFIQKAKDAKRIYASLVHIREQFLSLPKDETSPRYGFYREPAMTTAFLKTFYDEAKISPESVEYVEAFGSGGSAADKAELEAIDETFCKNRQKPLLVGSVMSNIGYCEAASGIAAVTKVLLGYKSGKLAANMHCDTPRIDVDAIRNGRIQVLTDHQDFNRTYTAVNGMSVTGVNAHVLLKGYYKPKDLDKYKCDIPRLVTISGRQDTAVEKIIQDLKSRPVDPEELALFHNIHQSRISGHMGRGYVILDTTADLNTVSVLEKVAPTDDAKRPLCFVYSGMGSQWSGMGAQLMKIPIFAAAIERCDKVLQPRGIDIVSILTAPDEGVFENILHCFVGIAAVQIGLTDVLRELGIVPDYIIGHSVGELGCAYADGCFTAEEMVLAAYCRGLVSLQTPLIHGAMAAVGLGYQQIVSMLPSDIEVACHNSATSCTISGPAESLREFVSQLTARKIFAKEVPCSNIAYHSRYIAKAGPSLLKHLKEVIKSPKPRSERWVSTSVPRDKWCHPDAKYCSAEYHTNNLLNPVLFEETSSLIPFNAVVVEIAPHGLLQAILKRSLPDSCRNIPLTLRGHNNSIVFFLEAIGKLFLEGFNPRVHMLYPAVEFPVSTDTPFLSHQVEWFHNEKWPLPLYVSALRKVAASCQFLYSPYSEDQAYLQGHVIRGQKVLPFSAVLVAVWDTLAMALGVEKQRVPVEFKNVHLYCQPLQTEHRNLKIRVSVHRGTGQFEVMEGKSMVASGYISQAFSDAKSSYLRQVPEKNRILNLQSEDIYQLFYERDYAYTGDFQSILSASSSLDEAHLLWRKNWVTLLDGMMQLNSLRRGGAGAGVAVPSHIGRISIDTKYHEGFGIAMGDNVVMKANVFDLYGYTNCGGVLIENIMFRDVPTVRRSEIILKSISEGKSSVLKSKLPTGKRISLRSGEVGDISSLHWVEAPETTEPGILVTVNYAGLNDCDGKRITGEIPFQHDKQEFGMDFSGLTVRGERVMGVVARGSLSSHVRALPELLWPVPGHWSLQDAATVPLAYAHAFYLLAIKSNLQPQKRILVHGGAGALGQAVISIALAFGCEMFTTVSDRRKRRCLTNMFPTLSEDHIGYSRDDSFQDMVMRATSGAGCDIVINCLKGNLKNTAFNCCSGLGTFIDTVQIPTQEHFTFGMHYLTQHRTYSFVDFSSIFLQDNRDEMRLIQTLMSEGITRGYVRPLSRVTYATHEVCRGFNLLSAQGHRGRVLVRLNDDDCVSAEPRYVCSADKCHIVVSEGSEDHLSLALAEKLATQCGVKHLRLHCTSPPNIFGLKLKSWQKLGVNVEIFTDSLNINKHVETLLNNTLVPVEAIYIISSSCDQRDCKGIVRKMDVTSRKLCVDIKYFAVVNFNNSAGEQECVSRIRNKLPATYLTLPALRKIDCIDSGKLNTVSSHDAVDAILRALQSSQSMLRAENVQTSQPSLLKQIAAVSGIHLPPKAGGSVTLQELGLTAAKAESVRSLLRDVHSVWFSSDAISLLTLDVLRELEERSSESKLPEAPGLSGFFSYVDSDELTATTDIVFLPTLTNDASMRDDEFDMDQDYLFIVPGLEGHYERFRILCEGLKMPALVLQPGIDNLHCSLEEVAGKYAQLLLKKTNLKHNFYLLGYETGISIALEVAAILEDHGASGTVFCLGAAPEDIRNHLQNQVSCFQTEEALQNAVACHMVSLITEDCMDAQNLNMALMKKSWKDKVEACTRTVLSSIPYSRQYKTGLIEAAYARISQALRYVAKPRSLRSKIILLRAKIPHKNDIQRRSQKKVVTYNLSSQLPHAAIDLRCASVINSHLSNDMLTAFEKKNLCETYLLNAGEFMRSSND